MTQQPPTTLACQAGRTGGEPPRPAVAVAPPDFERVVAEHHARVARLVGRLLGWDAAAEEVVQEVFLSALESMQRFRGEAALSTWLTRIAVNKCRSRIRKRFVRRRLFGALLRRARRQSAASADSPALENEKYERVRDAVSRLPIRFREVVVLRYLEELEIDRISEILGASRNAVEVRLSRARARLKESLAGLAET